MSLEFIQYSTFSTFAARRRLCHLALVNGRGCRRSTGGVVDADCATWHWSTGGVVDADCAIWHWSTDGVVDADCAIWHWSTDGVVDADCAIWPRPM